MALHISISADSHLDATAKGIGQRAYERQLHSVGGGPWKAYNIASTMRMASRSYELTATKFTNLEIRNHSASEGGSVRAPRGMG